MTSCRPDAWPVKKFGKRKEDKMSNVRASRGAGHFKQAEVAERLQQHHETHMLQTANHRGGSLCNISMVSGKS